MERIKQSLEELKTKVENHLSKKEYAKAQEAIINFYEEHYNSLPQKEKEEVRKLGIQVIKESIKKYAGEFWYKALEFKSEEHNAEIWSNLAQEMEKISEQELIQKFAKTALHTSPVDFQSAILGALISADEKSKNQLLLEAWAVAMSEVELYKDWEPESYMLEQAKKAALFLPEEMRKPLIEIISKYSEIPEMKMKVREKVRSGSFNSALKISKEIESLRINTIKEISKHLDGYELKTLLDDYSFYVGLNEPSNPIYLKLLEIAAGRFLFTQRE